MSHMLSRRTCLMALGAGLCGLALLAIRPAACEPAPQPDRDDRLVIHEWGTFTSLQDEQGRSIAGINTDDEPVPAFVHRLADLVNRPSDLAPVYYKGVPRLHGDMVMRLETPVIYFYPPRSQEGPLTLDVRVAFRGGWLTEYYPQAEAEAPGLRQARFQFGRLTRETVGSLDWNGLTVGVDDEGPQTDEEVWLAPRRVSAASVRTPEGESEKYLFYRGVGKIDAPLAVVRDAERNELSIREQFDSSLNLPFPLGLRALWLVHVREDGAVAWRPLGPAEATGERGRVIATTPADFDAAGYNPQNLDRLRHAMKLGLTADGLFDDEAEAMLDTWQLAYFKSPGLRLFFLLPQEWTDAVLPLECSMEADVVRTMVGRIELVTPRHRELLKTISAAPAPSSDWFYRSIEEAKDRDTGLRELWEGRGRLSALAHRAPDDYRAYLELGRFRNALILDAISRGTGDELKPFARAYALSYYGRDE